MSSRDSSGYKSQIMGVDYNACADCGVVQCDAEHTYVMHYCSHCNGHFCGYCSKLYEWQEEAFCNACNPYEATEDYSKTLFMEWMCATFAPGISQKELVDQYRATLPPPKPLPCSNCHEPNCLAILESVVKVEYQGKGIRGTCCKCNKLQACETCILKKRVKRVKVAE